MKKNLIKLAFSTLCAASVLMGCTQKNVNDTQMKNEKMIDSKGTQKSAIEIPNGYHKEINSVVFDIDTLEIPEGIILDNLHKCSITKQKPDQEKILELYSNGKEIVKSDSMESTTLDGSTGLYEYRAFSDGSQINAADGNVGWMTKFASKISYSFDAYNLDKYATSGEFDFGSRENSLQLVLDELKRYGYEIDDYEYTCILLDYETMKEEELHEEKVGEELDIHSEWSAEDNCYAFYINPKEQGVPVYFGNEFFMEDTDPTMMPVAGLVSANGIAELHINNLYSFEKKDDLYKLTDFDSCAETIANKYGEILSETQYRVERAKLYFVPLLNEKGGYDVKLAWLFEVDLQNGNSDKEYVIIDAENGEEITL